MQLLPLVFFLWPEFVAANDSECNGSLPLNVNYDSPPTFTEDQFATLLRCPVDSYCCRNYSTPYEPIGEYTCSCAPNCPVYGDCCWDAPMTDWIYDTSRPPSSCVSVDIQNLSLGPVHMVTGCSSTWPRDEVFQGCEDARNYSDPFYSIPATSPRGVTYYNGYCAICNYDVEDVIFWNASMSVGGSSVLMTVPEAVLNNPNVQLRQCDSLYEFIERCRVTQNTEWMQRCESYFAPVWDWEHDHKVIYKNVYCALCNDKDLWNLTCAPMYVQRGTSRIDSPGPNIINVLRLVTNRPDCLYWQGSTCYIHSAEYHFSNGSDEILNGSDANETNSTSLEEVSINYSTQSYLTIVCISMSLICLALKALVYAIYKSSRGFSSKCTLCLSSTLFLSHLLFLLANSFSLPENVCMISAVILHYSFLATFFWTSVLSYDIWKGVATDKVSRGGHRRVFIRYCVIAWCCPLCLVFIPAIVDYTKPSSSVAPRYGQGSCWISSAGAQALFFLTPMAILTLLNVFLYIHIVVHIRRTVKQAGSFEFRSRPQQSRMGLYVKLALIMGASWILGFLSAFFDSDVTDIIVIVLIGLQGAYLFFGFKDYRYFIDSFRSQKGVDRTTNGTTETTKL